MATKLYDAVVNQGRSESFINYIKHLGDARSRQEEDAIVKDDLLKLRAILAQPITDPRRLQECVVRLFYAEMLGHGAEFGYIHCINLCSSSLLRCKRTGYLATWLCVSPEHELMYLIVANMQKDLNSDNYLIVAAALTAAATLLRPELMAVVLKEVTALLTHTQPLVRRKAVEALHAFAVKSDGGVAEPACVLRALGDVDPAVVDAALRLLHHLLPAQRAAYCHLLDPLLNLLRQVIERRLPKGYNFHGVPAPWMQVHLIRLVGLVVDSNDDTTLAQRCEDTLVAVMRRADCGVRVGFAIMYEVIRTVASAMPGSARLLQMANEAVTAFLAATSKPNLRYAGVQALSLLVRANRANAALHQRRILDCLADPDSTIRGKAIAILFEICDQGNVELISHRLMRFLTKTRDTGLRRSIACRLCELILRDAPSATWYVATMNELLRIAPEHIPQAAVQRLLKAIAEGDGGYDGDDEEYASENADVFRSQCVQLYFDLTSQRVSDRTVEDTADCVPELLLRVAAWVMGEYGYVSSIGAQTLLDRLCDLLERSQDVVTREWLLTAMMKLAAQGKGVDLGPLRDLVDAFARDHCGVSSGDEASVDLWQRCYEFTQLLQRPELMRRVLPCDGCCADFVLDPHLSFLDDMVQEALRRGARPYADDARRRAIVVPSTAVANEVLRTEAYAPAPRVDSTMLYSVPYTAGAPLLSTMASTSPATPSADAQQDEQEQHGSSDVAAVKLVVRPQTRRWGKQSASVGPHDAASSVVNASSQPSCDMPAAPTGGTNMVVTDSTAHADPAVQLNTRRTRFMHGLLAGMQSRTRVEGRRTWTGRVDGGSHDGEHRRTVGATAARMMAAASSLPRRGGATRRETPSPLDACDALNALFTSQPQHDRQGPSAAETSASHDEAESSRRQSIGQPAQLLVEARKELNVRTTRFIFRVASPPTAIPEGTAGQVALRLRCPVGCTLTHLSCSAPAASVQGLEVYLPPGTPTTVATRYEVSAVLQLVAPFPQVDVVGGVVQAELVVCDGDEARTSLLARALLTVELGDLLRPAEDMVTGQFAELWPRLAVGEVRGGWTVNEPSSTTMQTVQQAAETVGLHCVEVIGHECIAVARVVNTLRRSGDVTSDTSTLLCHLAITYPATLQVTVRSAHTVLSAALVHALEALTC